MKVYRGPKSADFSADAHQLVDSPEIKRQMSLWHDQVLIRADLSKEAQERFSVAHIALDASDVMAMHSALIAGLATRSANLDKLRKHVEEARKHLQVLFNAMALGEQVPSVYGLQNTSRDAQVVELLGYVFTELDQAAR